MNAITTIEAPEATLWLDVPKAQSFEEWQAMGEKLHRTERVLNWWIGDWWAAGSHRYGERAKVAAEGIFGVGFGALANTASVCRAFESSRRREALTFTHHAEVAALPPADADATLDQAQSANWSTRQVRVEAMKLKVKLGLLRPRDEPDYDPITDGYNEIGAAFNRRSFEARIHFLEALEEMGVIPHFDRGMVHQDVPL